MVPDERSARYERLGSPGSKPWTMSYAPFESATERLARHPTGTPMLLRREIGTAGPIAITSASAAPSSELRPALRCSARPEGASTVTVLPSSRSPAATPATWSLTSCGADHENGVTRQTLIAAIVGPASGADPAVRPCAWTRGALRLRRGPGGLARVLLDEALGVLARLVVADLLRRRLHQVRARRLERAGDPVVERQLGEPDGVDDDAGRVGRVPDLELQLDVQRDVAERLALHADVRPL